MLMIVEGALICSAISSGKIRWGDYVRRVEGLPRRLAPMWYATTEPSEHRSCQTVESGRQFLFTEAKNMVEVNQDLVDEYLKKKAKS